MRKIARDKGSPDTDTTRDYVYTDWTGYEVLPKSSWRLSFLRARVLPGVRR